MPATRTYTPEQIAISERVLGPVCGRVIARIAAEESARAQAERGVECRPTVADPIGEAGDGDAEARPDR